MGAEFSFVPIKTWPTDLILVTPQSGAECGITQQIDWICAKLGENAALLQALIAEGGSIDISAWSHSGNGIGEFALSSNQIEVLAQHRVSVFFRFVVNEIFNE